RLMGQLAVLTEPVGAEIHVAAHSIGKALFFQLGDNGDDLVDVLGGQRMDGGRADIQTGCVLFVFLHVPAGNGQVIAVFLVGLVDVFVVDVGEVLNIGDLHAPVFQIAAQHVKHADGTGVADVDVVVYGGAAGVNFQLARCHGYKLFFLT